MSNGIDWFRWHHGSVTDPKFQLVARRSGASVPDVLAVWAFLLESASAASPRGCYGDIDTEAVDCLFNFPPAETRTADIIAALEDRRMLADGCIAEWDKRQTKRERADDSSADRVAAHRARKAAATATPTPSLAPTTVLGDGVTPCNASNGTETPREEKSREEKIQTKSKTKDKSPSAPDDLFPGVDPQVVTDFKALRAKHKAPITKTAIDGILREADKAGTSLEGALRICCERGWRGFKADWVLPPSTGSPRASPQQASRHSGFENINYSEGIENGRIT